MVKFTRKTSKTNQNLANFIMNPSKQNTNQGYLFHQRLSKLLNPKHELFKLVGLIDWERLEKTAYPVLPQMKTKDSPQNLPVS